MKVIVKEMDKSKKVRVKPYKVLSFCSLCKKKYTVIGKEYGAKIYCPSCLARVNKSNKSS